MAILRNPVKAKYTNIDNAMLRDPTLSLKAKGLLVTMLSFPDSWEFSENGLEQIFPKDGQASIRAGLKELESSGYLSRKRHRGDNGLFTCVEWTVTDHPQCDFPHVDNPHVEKPRLEKPNVEKPRLENPPQLNTNKLNTNKSNTKGIYSRFDEFWNAYPKKRSKGQAEKTWARLAKEKALPDIAVILSAVSAQIASRDWQEEGGKFIPYPATWLNSKGWEDQITTVVSSSASSAPVPGDLSKAAVARMMEQGSEDLPF